LWVFTFYSPDFIVLGTFRVQVLPLFVSKPTDVDVDTLLQQGFFVWDCGMLGGAGMKKLSHFCA
jgi:hypothetical protein